MARRRSFRVLPGRGGLAASEVFVATNENVPARPGRTFEVLPPRWAPRGKKSTTDLVVWRRLLRVTYFLVLAFGFAVLVAFTTLAAAAFFGAAFFATVFLAAAGF
jgi:hypothetical protein